MGNSNDKTRIRQRVRSNLSQLINNPATRATKSVFDISVSTIGASMPNISNIVLDTKDFAREVASKTPKIKFLNRFTKKSFDEFNKKERTNSHFNTLIKNLNEDLKSGNWNTSRGEDEYEDDLDDLGFDDLGEYNSSGSSGDDDDSYGPDDLESGDIFVAQANARATSVSTSKITNAVASSAVAQMNLSKQLSMSSMKFQAQVLNTGFNTLNNSLTNLVTFHATAMNDHITNSANYYDSQLRNSEKIIELLENMNSKSNDDEKPSFDPSTTQFSKLFGQSGRELNIKEYINQLKRGLSDEFGDVFDMIKEELAEFRDNPMKTLVKKGVNSVTKRTRYALEDFDKGFQNMLLNLMHKIGKNDSIGTEHIGAQLRAAKFNSGSYYKGDMSWNGYSQKALLSVIPGYLSRIESAIKNSDNEIIFDYEKGKWITKDHIVKYKNDKNKSIGSEALEPLQDHILSVLSDKVNDKERQQFIGSFDRLSAEVVKRLSSGKEVNFFKDFASGKLRFDNEKLNRIFIDLTKMSDDIRGINGKLKNEIEANIYRALNEYNNFVQEENLKQDSVFHYDELNTEINSLEKVRKLNDKFNGNNLNRNIPIQIGYGQIDNAVNSRLRYRRRNKNIINNQLEPNPFIVSSVENNVKNYIDGLESSSKYLFGGKKHDYKQYVDEKTKNIYDRRSVLMLLNSREDFQKRIDKISEKDWYNNFKYYNIAENIDEETFRKLWRNKEYRAIIASEILQKYDNFDSDKKVNLSNKENYAKKLFDNLSKDLDKFNREDEYMRDFYIGKTPKDIHEYDKELAKNDSDYISVNTLNKKGDFSIFETIKSASQIPDKMFYSMYKKFDSYIYNLLFGDGKFFGDESYKGVLPAATQAIKDQTEILKEEMGDIVKSMKDAMDLDEGKGLVKNILNKIGNTQTVGELRGNIKRYFMGSKDQYGNIVDEGLLRQVGSEIKAGGRGLFNLAGDTLKLMTGLKDYKYPHADGGVVGVSDYEYPSFNEESDLYDTEKRALTNYVSQQLWDGGSVQKFAKGGIVDKVDFKGTANKFLASLFNNPTDIKHRIVANDDGGKGVVITAQEGEAVFTVDQTRDLIRMIKLLSVENDIDPQVKTLARSLSVSLGINDAISKSKSNLKSIFSSDENLERGPVTKALNGVVGSFKSLFDKTVDSISDATEEQSEKLTKASNVTKLIGKEGSKHFQSVLAGGILGGGITAFTGLLNPFLGFAVGAGIALSKKSSKVSEALFGDSVEDDEDGVKSNKSKILDYIKEKLPTTAMGGVLGAVGSTFLMGNPIPGLLIGSSIAHVKQSDKYLIKLFGNGDIDKYNERKEKIKKLLPFAGVGAAALALTGPFGLVGNMLLGGAVGASTGIMSVSEKFQTFVFGTKAYDGKYYNGLLPTIRDRVIDPVTKGIGKLFSNISNWFKDGIFSGLRRGLDPLASFFRTKLSNMRKGGKKFRNFVKNKTRKAWEWVKGTNTVKRFRNKVDRGVRRFKEGAISFGKSAWDYFNSRPLVFDSKLLYYMAQGKYNKWGDKYLDDLSHNTNFDYILNNDKEDNPYYGVSDNIRNATELAKYYADNGDTDSLEKLMKTLKYMEDVDKGEYTAEYNKRVIAAKNKFKADFDADYKAYTSYLDGIKEYGIAQVSTQDYNTFTSILEDKYDEIYKMALNGDPEDKIIKEVIEKSGYVDDIKNSMKKNLKSFISSIDNASTIVPSDSDIFTGSEYRGLRMVLGGKDEMDKKELKQFNKDVTQFAKMLPTLLERDGRYSKLVRTKLVDGFENEKALDRIMNRLSNYNKSDLMDISNLFSNYHISGNDIEFAEEMGFSDKLASQSKIHEALISIFGKEDLSKLTNKEIKEIKGFIKRELKSAEEGESTLSGLIPDLDDIKNSTLPQSSKEVINIESLLEKYLPLIAKEESEAFVKSDKNKKSIILPDGEKYSINENYIVKDSRASSLISNNSKYTVESNGDVKIDMSDASTRDVVKRNDKLTNAVMQSGVAPKLSTGVSNVSSEQLDYTVESNGDVKIDMSDASTRDAVKRNDRLIDAQIDYFENANSDRMFLIDPKSITNSSEKSDKTSLFSNLGSLLGLGFKNIGSFLKAGLSGILGAGLGGVLKAGAAAIGVGVAAKGAKTYLSQSILDILPDSLKDKLGIEVEANGATRSYEADNTEATTKLGKLSEILNNSIGEYTGLSGYMGESSVLGNALTSIGSRVAHKSLPGYLAKTTALTKISSEVIKEGASTGIAIIDKFIDAINPNNYKSFSKIFSSGKISKFLSGIGFLNKSIFGKIDKFLTYTDDFVWGLIKKCHNVITKASKSSKTWNKLLTKIAAGGGKLLSKLIPAVNIITYVTDFCSGIRRYRSILGISSNAQLSTTQKIGYSLLGGVFNLLQSLVQTFTGPLGIVLLIINILLGDEVIFDGIMKVYERVFGEDNSLSKLRSDAQSEIDEANEILASYGQDSIDSVTQLNEFNRRESSVETSLETYSNNSTSISSSNSSFNLYDILNSYSNENVIDDTFDFSNDNTQSPSSSSNSSNMSTVIVGTGGSTLDPSQLDYVGRHVKQYESGNSGSESISTGKGDNGGVSYGTFQFASKAQEGGTIGGSAKAFWDKYYKEKNPNVSLINNDTFYNTWKREVSNNPVKFLTNEHEKIVTDYYNPVYNGTDFDIKPYVKSRAMQESILSTSVQYGASGARKIFKNALGNLNPNTTSQSDLIAAIQDYKYDNVNSHFASSSDSIKKSLKNNRIPNEKTLLQSLTGLPTLDIDSVNEGGFSEVTGLDSSSIDGDGNTGIKGVFDNIFKDVEGLSLSSLLSGSSDSSSDDSSDYPSSNAGSPFGFTGGTPADDFFQYKVTSKYGEPRSDGVHGGIDYGYPEGTPVNTPVSGRVEISQYNDGGYGHYVGVRDDNNMLHVFGHLKQKGLAVGKNVDAGDQIGISGNTGSSTGPHLHYEVTNTLSRNGRKAEDPNLYLANYVSSAKSSATNASVTPETGTEGKGGASVSEKQINNTGTLNSDSVLSCLKEMINLLTISNTNTSLISILVELFKGFSNGSISSNSEEGNKIMDNLSNTIKELQNNNSNSKGQYEMLFKELSTLAIQ